MQPAGIPFYVIEMRIVPILDDFRSGIWHRVVVRDLLVEIGQLVRVFAFLRRD
jgi:hypothetical protein